MKHTINKYNPKQGRLPVYIADILDICDPVLTFDRIMEEMEDCTGKTIYIVIDKKQANILSQIQLDVYLDFVLCLQW